MSFFFQPTEHADAVKFIADKPVVSRQVFEGLLPELQARAVCVSGVTAADVVADIRDAIATLPAGGDWDEIKRTVLAELHPFLVDDSLQHTDPEKWQKQIDAADRRAELLIRTHGQQAYAASQWQIMDEQRAAFPFWQYQSMGDSHVRHSHRLLDGIVLPHDHPFWSGHFPPWEWGCRCIAVAITQADFDQIQAEDARRLPEQRLILDGPALQKLEQDKEVWRGPTLKADVRTPAERAAETGETPFRFDPSSLRLPVKGLLARYDAQTAKDWTKWAKSAPLRPGESTTVWQWLQKSSPKPKRVRKPAAAPAAPDAFPADPDGARVLRRLGGSTGAELVEIGGRKFVRKRGTSAEHLREEAAADAIYQAADIDVPEFMLYETAAGPVKLARFVEGRSLADVLAAGGTAADEALARVREGFLIDAALGNWDVAGLSLDNIIIVDGQVRPWRIDNGGALRYRARGVRKTAAEWGAVAGEVDSLRDPAVNPAAARVFAGLTDDDLRSQAEALKGRRDAMLAAAADPEVRAMLAARIDGLIGRFAPEPSVFAGGFDALVRAARVKGKTHVGDRDLVEDLSVLFWEETDAAGLPVLRARLRLTEAGGSAMDAALNVTATAPASDQYWLKIEPALRHLNHHAETDKVFNQAKLANAHSLRPQLTAQAAGADPTAAAQARHYLDILDAMLAAEAAKEKTPLFAQFVAPPPAAARRGVRATPGTVEFEAKSRDRGFASGKGGSLRTVQGAYRAAGEGGAELAYIPWHSSADYAFRGMVEVRVPGGATPANLSHAAKLLAEAGVDITAATAAHQELVYLRKGLEFQSHGGSLKPAAAARWRAIADDPALDDAAKVERLKDFVKKEMKLDLRQSADYRPEGGEDGFAQGWRRWERWDLPRQEIEREMQGWGLTHHTGATLDSLIDSWLHGGGQVTPTTERLRVGVALTSGMSPDADLGTGGANYFFTRIAQPATAAAHRGFVFKIGALARLDAFSFGGDKFGDVRPAGQNTHGIDPRGHRAKTVSEFKTYGAKGSNETIFKWGLSLLDDIEVIRCRSAAERKRVLAVFKSHGYSKLPDGRAITAIIQ